MAVIETWFKQDLKSMVAVHNLPGTVFTADNDGNLIGIEVFDDGVPADIAGSVSANIIRPDGGTVSVGGTLADGNRCSVILPQAAYAYPGPVAVIIKLTSGNTVTTIGAAVGTCTRSTTGTVVDPGTIIPSVQNLIDEIEAAIADVPASATNLRAALAETYSTSGKYAVGSYAWQEGVLYRCTTAITSGETWTSAHWTEAKLANDVSDLKSAFLKDVEQITGNEPLIFQKGQYRVYNDNTVSDLTEPVTDTTTAVRMVCAKCACSPGDVFYLKARGKASSASAYGFFNANFEGIARGGTNTLFDSSITAPANAAWFVVNNDIVDNPDDYHACKGVPLVSLVSKSFKYIGALTESNDLNNIFDPGWYRWTSSHIPDNVPQNYGGYMLEYATSTTAGLQIVITTGGLKTIWFRILTSSGWDADWVRVARYDQLSNAVDSIKGIISDFKSTAFNSVPFVQGSIGSTGSVTDSDIRIRIRTGYIPIASLAEATCDNGGWLSFYCYNMSRVYLGRVTTGLQSVTKSTILESYPTATYVRFVFRVTGDPDITPDDAATYNLLVYTNPAEFYQATTQPLTLQMVAERMTDSVLTESLAYKWHLENGDDQDYILTMRAKYTTTGDSVPYVRIYAYSAIDSTVMIYTGPSYEIAKSAEFVEQSWRLPNAYSIGSYQINIQIPTGCTLAIETLTVKHDMGIRRTGDGLRFHAHMGFDALFPSGSYDGIVSAAKLGFESCIVIPKITADGVPICFHDDNSISGQMTQVDGSAIPSEYDVAIQTLTYDQLMQWSIGYSKNPIYAGAKILKMDDFLYICAKTGMRPIFSVHPQHSEANWQVFKTLLDKYGLTSRFSVKSANYDETWKRVINVFGDGNIYSIINLYSTSSTYNILNYINTGKSVAGITKTRIDVEFFLQTLEAGTTLAQTQLAQLQAALGAGYVCSCVLEANTHSNVMKKYIDMGVTEFTEGRHCSLGLNW